MELRSSKAVLIWLIVFAIIFVLAAWIVREREHSCAKSCRLTGFASYEYKGFAGGGSTRARLRPDSCKCINIGGSPSATSKW